MDRSGLQTKAFEAGNRWKKNAGKAELGKVKRWLAEAGQATFDLEHPACDAFVSECIDEARRESFWHDNLREVLDSKVRRNSELATGLVVAFANGALSG